MTASQRPRRSYVDGPYGQMHVRRLGAGPAIVLLHQAAMDSRQFDAVYPLLAARGFEAIGIDLPGFGNSDGTSFVPQVEDLAVAIIAAIRSLDLAPAFLVGHHTGSMVATEVALQAPELVSRLVLNGPMPLTDEERTEFFADKHLREKAMGPGQGYSYFADFAAIRERQTAGSVPASRISSYVVQCFGGDAPFWYGHNAGFNYRHEDSLPKLSCPTLILTNTGDQIYQHALRAKALRPDMDFVALEGGGVDIVDQQPDAWVDVVSTFLR